jgi:hypothetical protein
MLGNGGTAMTEAQWLACEDDPWEMFETMAPICIERKGRLLAIACLRRIWRVLDDMRSRRLVEVADQFVEGTVGLEEWAVATSEAWQAHYEASERFRQLHREARYDLTAPDGERIVWAHGVAAGLGSVMTLPHITNWREQVLHVISQASSVFAKPPAPTEEEYNRELLAQCILLREIFGNPFCPISFSPAWRTDTALSLAHQMYESRDFGAMPILADALQDAGCDSDDILNHCRDANATHVRGCWVVDLVLGKE